MIYWNCVLQQEMTHIDKEKRNYNSDRNHSAISLTDDRSEHIDSIKSILKYLRSSKLNIFSVTDLSDN